MRVLLQISSVASTAVERASAAAEILSLLEKITPYAAATLVTWDPLSDHHQPLSDVGYPPEIITNLDTLMRRNDGLEFMRDVDSRPHRWRDLPFDFRRMPAVAETFIPAGFNEGAGALLRTPDGRPTGSLHINTDTPRHPDDAAMDALAILQSTLPGLVDVLRTPSFVVASLNAAVAAAIVTPAGSVIALAGRDPGPHLRERSPLTELIVVMLRGDRLVPRWLWQDENRTLHRVRSVHLQGGALVTESRTRPPYQLTNRELDILTLLANGYSNPEIAAKLVVTSKTVAKHVEHLLEKLACASRAAVAARATAEGLLRLPLASSDLKVPAAR